jgi:hypothetical protein
LKKLKRAIRLEKEISLERVKQNRLHAGRVGKTGMKDELRIVDGGIVDSRIEDSRGHGSLHNKSSAVGWERHS